MIKILTGDALGRLRELPDESVQCCVTSPPYWGLRDYGTAEWEGGASSCDHAYRVDGGSAKQLSNTGGSGHVHRDCKCGARRVDSQLGLERTPELFVAKMVAVFREVRRVLRRDGTLWMNLGDSYWSDTYVKGAPPQGYWNTGGMAHREGRMTGGKPAGLKPKDLCGIPWRVAFALQADGWWLRSDIIWAKPNPMPESVTDRPTKSHEYLFLLTKSASYFYDAEAIKEKAEYGFCEGGFRGGGAYINNRAASDNSGDWKGVTVHTSPDKTNPSAGRNKRSVWTVATAPYPAAHFATYPPDLVKPCIMAGTSAKGCCAKCGAPWERVVEAGESSWEARKAAGHKASGYHAEDGALSSFENPKVIGRRSEGGLGWVATKETLGWQPTCKCDAGVEPCVVLDPFAGSGTTGAVALELGRKAVLIELNPKYVELIEQRCNVTMGLALA